MKKVKNIILVFLAILFLGIGFSNFKIEDDKDKVIAKVENERTGDVELVNSEPVKKEEESSEADANYFSDSRMQRDKMYSQLLESYQKIVDSNELKFDQKSIAINEIKKINNIQNKISISENLIKNKGFNDVIIFANENSISVVIKSNISLNKEQIAQIQNITSRELGCKIQEINISIK